MGMMVHPGRQSSDAVCDEGDRQQPLLAVESRRLLAQGFIIHDSGFRVWAVGAGPSERGAVGGAFGEGGRGGGGAGSASLLLSQSCFLNF